MTNYPTGSLLALISTMHFNKTKQKEKNIPTAFKILSNEGELSLCDPLLLAEQTFCFFEKSDLERASTMVGSS
ncbi:hypothetical protein DICVIV_04447 [Dictyocaulus viviparus]|uniref:Uncharacterized protein n=1 Tax=Dictyocaulus viviparus TaxID=29172 RepID=A0A0D8XY54_DICVI|nr:hypothetical protein DICVIV_04447 [Dictyocaulus viviparus]